MTAKAPVSSRLHIVFAGERNSGKSSLLNAVAGQEAAIVSPTPGTTTDCVSKAIEIPGLGPCVLVDTAGLDDCGELGGKRVAATLEALKAADIVIAVIDASTGRLPDLPGVAAAGKAAAEAAPVLPVISKCDLVDSQRLAALSEAVRARYGKNPVQGGALSAEIPDNLTGAIRKAVPEDWDAPLLTSGTVPDGGLALLVMPQDSESPKGRLILPQQQVLRELLDRGCRAICCPTEGLASALGALKDAPDAIITDSRDFAAVKALTPPGTVLTSFSILLAAAKGDLDYFKRSARALDSLGAQSRVLIAEACTHVPDSEDTGRVKIPRLLRSRAGEGLRIDTVSGRDFPSDLTPYDLVIHCGACMFNRRYVLSRVEQARGQGVPMTNYGVAIAYLNNILE